jgi:hypothetical protein
MASSDDQMRQRQAEKNEALADITAVLHLLQEQRRSPDGWERVHLVRAFALIFSGSYVSATEEARLALTPTSERSPLATLSHDHRYNLPLLMQLLEEAKAAQVRPFPHFGRIEVR